ncbi:hypothetical protein AB0B94_26080 [Micromonospora sp. NPDC048986]|uniref:hypothetical protein n=1 Tax=Micromonospora sp. NPDC048986 TaxID=3155644 RepID=UPI0033FEC534
MADTLGLAEQLTTLEWLVSALPVGSVSESTEPRGPQQAHLQCSEGRGREKANLARDFQSIRPIAERDHKNIVSWHVYDKGNHFAAHAPRPAGERHPWLLAPTPLTHTQQVHPPRVPLISTLREGHPCKP